MHRLVIALVTLLGLAAAHARARGLRVARGAASAVEGPWPYAPVLEAFGDLSRSHPALLDGLDDAYREELDRALSGRAAPWSGESSHQRLFVAAAELARLAATGHGLLPFHANLLQAAIATATPVQPVALRFSEAANAVSEAVEFVGATSLLRSLWQTSCGEVVRVRVAFLAPRPSAHVDRLELAALLRADIAAALGIDADAAPATRV